jgi:hypothetical protein
MGLILRSIDDDRDALDKAKRKELECFAKANNVTEIKQGMPAILMRRILRNKRLTNIQTPPRLLGHPEAPQHSEAFATDYTEPYVTGQMDADTALLDQWERGDMKPAPIGEAAQPDIGGMGYRDLQKECKRRGIKMERGETMPSLKAKLNGPDTASVSQ